MLKIFLFGGRLWEKNKKHIQKHVGYACFFVCVLHFHFFFLFFLSFFVLFSCILLDFYLLFCLFVPTWGLTEILHALSLSSHTHSFTSSSKKLLTLYPSCPVNALCSSPQGLGASPAQSADDWRGLSAQWSPAHVGNLPDCLPFASASAAREVATRGQWGRDTAVTAQARACQLPLFTISWQQKHQLTGAVRGLSTTWSTLQVCRPELETVVDDGRTKTVVVIGKEKNRKQKQVWIHYLDPVSEQRSATL